MSTKATIEYSRDWHLYEELWSEGEVWLRVQAHFVCYPGEVSVVLSPAVLDAIAKTHAAGQFPHQRKEDRDA